MKEDPSILYYEGDWDGFILFNFEIEYFKWWGVRALKIILDLSRLIFFPRLSNIHQWQRKMTFISLRDFREDMVTIKEKDRKRGCVMRN